MEQLRSRMTLKVFQRFGVRICSKMTYMHAKTDRILLEFNGKAQFCDSVDVP